MKKRFYISIIAIIAVLTTATGCDMTTTLPLENSSPVVDAPSTDDVNEATNEHADTASWESTTNAATLPDV